MCVFFSTATYMYMTLHVLLPYHKVDVRPTSIFEDMINSASGDKF